MTSWHDDSRAATVVQYDVPDTKLAANTVTNSGWWLNGNVAGSSSVVFGSTLMGRLIPPAPPPTPERWLDERVDEICRYSGLRG
jgi:hypothetical protein